MLSGLCRALGSYKALMSPMDGSRCIMDTGTSTAVDSEHVPKGERNGDDFETVATPPVELIAQIPEDFQHGETVTIAGPHGPIEVEPPQNLKPGDKLVYRLMAEREFRLVAPPGAKPGLQMEIERGDGVMINITVPPNVKPGDFFEVFPPALIVRVPDGAEAGDHVVYRPVVPPGARPYYEANSWLRAQVPEGLKPGQYFAARLPVPPEANLSAPPEEELEAPPGAKSGDPSRLWSLRGFFAGEATAPECLTDTEGATRLLGS